MHLNNKDYYRRLTLIKQIGLKNIATCLNEKLTLFFIAKRRFYAFIVKIKIRTLVLFASLPIVARPFMTAFIAVMVIDNSFFFKKI